MSRQIEVTNDEPALEIDASAVVKCLRLLDSIDQYPVAEGTIGVAFVNEATCSQLHEDFFNDPEPTDVMTFPGAPEDMHAGDIAICPKVAATQCTEQNTSFQEELTLYLVHAWLHLAGLEDKDPDSIKKMRAGESSLMIKLREASALIAAEWNI